MGNDVLALTPQTQRPIAAVGESRTSKVKIIKRIECQLLLPQLTKPHDPLQ